ncbi:MAG: hypothetical protein EA357_07810 [Micavibrio sp.]|nr:MAG: hypothetical protein EA357_07810 [Micavibrio sp.]
MVALRKPHPAMRKNIHPRPALVTTLTDDIRRACARVVENARHARICEEKIPDYAEKIMPHFPYENLWHSEGWHFHSNDEEAMAAYVLALDSINFGSGYFSVLEKRPGLSGYMTIATWLTDRFQQEPLTAHDMKNMSPRRCAGIFAQDFENPEMRELMEYFSKALNETGMHILDSFGGRFLDFVAAAEGSAVCFAQNLAGLPQFSDIAHYKGFAVPFFKRAQIAAADIHLAFEGQGPGYFHDLDRLTVFADNAVPHVLRMEGILHYTPELAARIDAEELLEPGSEEEVELRALAICAADKIVSALHDLGLRDVMAMNLDHYLWDSSHRPEYAEKPKHRTQTVYY